MALNQPINTETSGYCRHYRRKVAQGGAAPVPSDTDPSFSSVSLLLHADGFNGSTTFTDSSPRAKTVTPSGNTSISTAQSKFGGSSMYFDGSGDYVTPSASTDFDFGTGDFCIEMFARLPPTAAAFATLISCEIGTGFFTLYSRYGGINTVIFESFNGSGYPQASREININDSSWHHVAVTRSSNIIRVFVDGVNGGPFLSTAHQIGGASKNIRIGGDPPAGYYAAGWIDELRVTKGVARYTENFTPPTAAFPNS